MSGLILDDKNFEAEVLKSEKPVLVDFFAVWCGPCQMMAPIVDELAKENEGKSVKIAKLDIDQAPETAGKFQVMSVPTFILFKDGKEEERVVGGQSKESLTKIIEKYL